MAARQGTKIPNQRVLALDIGSRFIKIGELSLTRGSIALLNVVVAPTPPEMMDKSQILDPSGLGMEIRRLLKESKITTKKTVVAVRGQSSVVVRPIELPKMSKKELAETMKFEVERHIPFAANEVVMDYAPFVDPETLPETDENMKVLLAVAQEELVNAYLQMLKSAGLQPLALDVEILAAMRSLIDIYQEQGSYEQPVALVNLGASSMDICIITQGNLTFNRSVPIAGDALSTAISDQLGRSLEEAESLKIEQGKVYLDSAAGELPLPGEISQAGGGQDTFAAPTAMENTIAWAQDDVVPQQVFSLNDEDATPPPAAPVDAKPEAEDFQFFSFTDDADEPKEAPQTFTVDEPSGADAPVFDLSSELEGQMPTPLARPKLAETEPEEGIQTPDAPAAAAWAQPEPPAFATSPTTDLGSVTTQTPTAQRDVFQRRVFEAMQPTLTEIVSEIRRSLEFYANREPESPVERILLYGGTSRLENLAELIHQEIGITVQAADPLAMIETGSCQLPADYLRDVAPVLPICIGLGLRDMLA